MPAKRAVVTEVQPNGCVFVTSHKPDRDGYPYLVAGGKNLRIAHLRWIEANGPLPSGRYLRRSCDDTRCVNIDHMTVADKPPLYKELAYARTDAGCLECVSHRAQAPQGYPLVNRGGRSQKLVRLLWKERNGPIPPKIMVRHKCDNPRCVAMEHLELGTAADNNRDKAVRRRQPRKLGDAQRQEIRGSTASNQQLATRFGVSTATIFRVKREPPEPYPRPAAS